MSEFNDDELHPPSWLNEEFFEKAIVQDENDETVKVTRLEVTPGSAKGNHYASVIFRAKAIYDSDKSKGSFMSMIIKTIPELEGHKKNFIENSSLFKTEISMYANAIPELEAELRKIGDDTILGAKMLYQSLGERKFIILEDLLAKGYTTIQKRPANLEESKGALLKLAKWHAVSYKLAAEGETSVTKFCESFYDRKHISKSKFLSTGIDQFIDLVQNDDELRQYAPKLRAIRTEILKNCVNSFKSYRENRQGIYVLCHGDFHSKSLMVKRGDKGELEDVMLLDFQTSYFGPAILDIIYAIYLMFHEDQRNNQRDELIYYYSSNFIDTLKKLKFKGDYPQISDFYIDMFQHRHWEIHLLSTYLPLWYAYNDRHFDKDAPKETRPEIHKNPEYVSQVKRLLPILFHRGYLE